MIRRLHMYFHVFLGWQLALHLCFILFKPVCMYVSLILCPRKSVASIVKSFPGLLFTAGQHMQIINKYFYRYLESH